MEKQRRIWIAVCIVAIFALIGVLTLSILHKNINNTGPVDNTVVVVNPTDILILTGDNTEPSTSNNQEDIGTVEPVESTPEITDMDESYRVNEDTAEWIRYANPNNEGIQVVNSRNVLGDFDNGTMFNYVDPENLYITDEEWSWWVAIDNSSRDYYVYISLYDCMDKGNIIPVENRVGTKPIRLEITDQEIKNRIDWCIRNYPEGDGKITEGLTNAQYLLYIHDVGKHNGFEDYQNYANTRYGSSWAGINFQKLVNEMR